MRKRKESKMTPSFWTELLEIQHCQEPASHDHLPENCNHPLCCIFQIANDHLPQFSYLAYLLLIVGLSQWNLNFTKAWQKYFCLVLSQDDYICLDESQVLNIVASLWLHFHWLYFFLHVSDKTTRVPSERSLQVHHWLFPSDSVQTLLTHLLLCKHDHENILKAVPSVPLTL